MRSERRNHREQVEREIQGETYAGLLGQLHQACPPLCRFRTWTDVLMLMHDGSTGVQDKEEILRAILTAHAQNQDSRWRTVLLAMFWPGLDSLHGQKLAWDEDPEELWQNIVWTFLQVVCRIDLAKRPDRLIQKLINDTIHRLHDEYRRIWRRAKFETLVDTEDLDEIPTESGGIDFDLLDQRDRQEREIERLRKHMEEGRISEADFLLLVGTRVYGKLVREYAREVGLSFQTAKKRRLRAEARIRRFEEEGR